MKSFIISISVLLCLIGSTIGNAIYISNVTDSLLKEASEIEAREESVAEFATLWEKHKPFIKISSSFEETNRIDEAIVILKEKAKTNSIYGFYEERGLLVEYITKIQRDEQINLDNII